MKENVKNIIVLGAAESGVGAAILAKAKGYVVFVSDSGTIKEAYKNDLISYNISFEEGGHSEEKILSADCIIKSPGIPEKAEIVKKAREKNILIISEIEWASWFTKARIIGITGTNGKTTTTLLTYHILKTAGLNVGLAGNVGKSFAKSVAEDSFDYYVLEISSFQLDDIRHYKNNIAILTNITPDHLDRYHYNLEEYIDSKFRITNNQDKEDYFIYDADDKLTMKYAGKFPSSAKRLPISQEKEVFPGAYIKDDQLHIGINEINEITMDTENFTLLGKHNRYNMMAGALAAKIVDIRKETIRESLESFSNAEHRLQFIAKIRDVEFINDSKATNVNATWYALESMNRPIIWIAGGQDKGNDYESLKPLVKERVKALICLGIDNKKLVESFNGAVKKIVETTSMEDAVNEAFRVAVPGDVVLLAPACASFDLFINFEDRGVQFKKAVLNL